MNPAFPHVAARLYNTPLMIDGAKAAAILHGLGARILGGDGASIEIDGPEAIDHVAFAGGRPSMGRLGDPLRRRADERKLALYPVIDGVAVIGIEGSLVHKGKWVGSASGETSYEGLQAQVAAAKADPGVRGVVFEVDSFGGEVSGAFDAAEAIADLGKAKPTLAILTDHALSAGYLLASAARRIVMPETGRAGSIGVITLHVDMSRALDRQGVKVTVLAAGAHKGERNPYEPLPQDVAERTRADLDGAREAFARAVAGFRGERLSFKEAMATEAGHFAGPKAVSLGLADATGNASTAFAEFVREIGLPTAGYSAARPTASAAAPPALSTFLQADAPTERTAVDSDRARIRAILSADAAIGRETFAQYVALETDMTVEAALTCLAKAPKAAPLVAFAPTRPSLAQEMAGQKKIDLGFADRGPEQINDFEQGAAAARALIGKSSSL